MTIDNGSDSGSESVSGIEAQIAEWLGYMAKRRELTPADAEELEDHLRSRIDDLTEAGLTSNAGAVWTSVALGGPPDNGCLQR